MKRVPLTLVLVLVGLLALITGCTSAGSTASSGNEQPSASAPTAAATEAEEGTTAARSETVTLQRDDIQLAGTLDVPALADDQQVPLVLLLHGLGGSQNDTVIQTTAQTLNQAGIATLRIDFDGHGDSGGDIVDMTVPSEIEDARTAYEYARSLSFVSSIGLVGHSQGGVVASMLAGQLGEQITAMALLAPASTIPEMARNGNFLGTEFDASNPPDSISVDGVELGRQYILTAQKLQLDQVASQYTGPVEVIQGQDDDVLPVESTEKFATVFSNVDLQVLPGQGHEFAANPDEPAGIIQDFMSSNLS